MKYFRKYLCKTSLGGVRNKYTTRTCSSGVLRFAVYIITAGLHTYRSGAWRGFYFDTSDELVPARVSTLSRTYFNCINYRRIAYKRCRLDGYRPHVCSTALTLYTEYDAGALYDAESRGLGVDGGCRG